MRFIPNIPSLNPSGFIGGVRTSSGGGASALTYDISENGMLQVRTYFSLGNSKPFTMTDSGSLVKTPQFSLNNGAIATPTHNSDILFYVTGSIT